MVIFAGGKFRDYITKMLHVIAIFAVYTNMPSYLCLGVIFTQGNFHDKCTQSQRAQIYPHMKISMFTVV